MRKQILFVAGVGFYFCASGRASASLFATFNLNQQLYEFGEPSYNSEETTPVTDTALPFQTKVSQITATNGVTATYNAYDNGTTAGLTINSSAYTTALNNVAEEASGGPLYGGNYTTFSFTQPVSYTIAYQDSGGNPGGGLGGQFFLDASYYPNNIIDNTFLGTTFSQSGTLSPNVVYTMNEFWALNNLNNFNPADMSGTDSISLSFTAIPEPGSLSLIVLPAAMLARRRRRVASVRI